MVMKAADHLFTQPGMPLHYFHNKTNLYNDIFFDCWDNCFAPTFNIVCRELCPWFYIDNVESLNHIFDLEFKKWVYTIPF
jgi:hypothetical protein